MSATSRTERRVVIVDDSRTIQAMLESAFGARKDFRVIGVASDAPSATEMIKRLAPDIVTIDLCMPYIDGAALLEMLADLPAVCKVIVSDQCTQNVLMKSKLQDMGASACLSKRELVEDPATFFNKINLACNALQSARRQRLGLGDKVPERASGSSEQAPTAGAHFGYPVPQDESLRLDTLRRKRLANAVHERQFDLVTAHLAGVTDFPVCLLTFIDKDTQWLKSCYGLDEQSTPRGQAFCNYTIAQADEFVVSNAAQDERFAHNPLVVGAPHIRTYAGHPITTRNGVRIGALCLIDTRPRAVSRAVIRQLAGMAEILAEIIEQRPALAA
jgi:GAF domain-containing protein